jgi:uncharacterized GH25 family protein
MKRTLLCALLLTTVCATASAHDFWVQPTSAQPQVGTPVDLGLFVGDHFKNEGPDRAYNGVRVDKFLVASVEGELDLKDLAVENKRPFLRYTPKKAGGYLFGLQRTPLRIELEAERFNKYLEKEGVPTMLKLRESYGELEQLGRERYTRHMKTYVRAQAGAKPDHDKKKVWGKTLGFTLEIVPMVDPTSRKAGQELPVKVRYRDGPLAGAQVSILSAGEQTTATTDAKGQAVLTVPADGPMIIRLIHMHRCRDCKTEEWRSYWASYWFDNTGATK